jgi:MFS family permease
MNHHKMQTQAPSPAWILFFLSASVGVAMIGLGIIWPLVPVYAVDLGASGFQVGLIIAVFNVARALLNPFSGRLSDRWGRKPFIVLGLFLYGVVSVFYVMAITVESLILVRIIHGFTSVLVIPVAMALTGDIAPQHRLGLYMGTLNMAVMLGFAIGPVLGGGIREYFGMAAAFYSMGGLALVTLIGVWVFLPRDNRQKVSRSDQPVAPLNVLLKHRVVQGLFLLRFFIAAGQGSVYTFLPILALHMQITSSQVGLILGVNIFLIVFLQRICGDIADRVDPRYMIIGGTLLSALAVLGMPFVFGFYKILFLNIVMGIGNGIAMPGGFVITGQLGRSMGMGSVMGLTDTGWSVGMIVAPVMSGIIMDSLGVPSIFITGGVLTIIGVLLLAFFLRGYSPSPQDTSAVG